MPLENRVDPFGDIHAVDARGLFTGNRGTIHDDKTRTLLKKRWTSKMWIICDCGFKGRKRNVMGRNRPTGGPGWTNLFFLDEVTALAAGHRPCFECRRQAAKNFAGHFSDVFGPAKPKAPLIDARLHKERLASGGKPVAASHATIGDLPDGAMIADGQQTYAVRAGAAWPWSFNGYGQPVPLDDLAGRQMVIVTPATTVAVLRQGYRPVWHPTADA